LSAAACLRRVRKLREAGVFAAIVALVDAAKLGLEVHAYAFVASRTTIPARGAVREHDPAPSRSHRVRSLSGTHDFLMRVAVPSMTAYSEFLDTHLLPLPTVRSVSSSFELGVLKRTTALPTLVRPSRGSATSR
jgi:Lrp/AsnC family transcriptional regulator, leucine-responsive regulatory protein